jgi:NitT/TauT family transport system permease protein
VTSLEATPSRRMTIPFFDIQTLVSIVGFVVLILIWQNSGMPEFILPKPSSIAAKVVSDATTGLILPHLWVTFVEVIVGFAFATVLGVGLGSLMALVPVVDRLLYPYVLGFQTVPKVAVAPLFLIWFGFGLQSKVVTAGLIAFFPILVNVVAGLKTVEPRRVLLMRALKASSWETFTKVRFPSMLPYLFAGLEVGIIFSVIGAIVAEFVGSAEGLGSLIVQRQSAVDVAGVFSVLIYLSLMGLALNMVLKLVTRHFIFWAQSNNDRGI